jgi:hypothetical protein
VTNGPSPARNDKAIADRVAEFRQRQRRRPFRAQVLRVVADGSNPVRPTLAVLQPQGASDLEAWAEIPSWLNLTGDPEREDSLVRRLLETTLSIDPQSPFPDVLVRCVRSVRGAGPELIAVELLAPHETTRMFERPDESPLRTRCLGFVERRRLHAKTVKHVFGLGRRVHSSGGGWTPLTAVMQEQVTGSGLDVTALARAGCAIAKGLADLTHEEDYYDYCRKCSTQTLLAAEPQLSQASHALGVETREAIESAATEGDVASLPREKLGFASPKGILHFARRRGPAGASAFQGVTTYLARAGGFKSLSRQDMARAKLERNVREGRRRASWLRRAK